MIISSKFVREGYDDIEMFSPCVQFENALIESMIAYESYKRECERKIESQKLMAFMESTDVNHDVYIEAENNIFARLGKMIVDLVKKFTDMCNAVIQKVKDSIFTMKSGEKKLNQLCKEHPEYSKEQIRVLIAEGGLDFSDMKSLAELDSAFLKLVDMAKSKNVDPDSFKGKCKEFETRLKSNDTKIQKVAVLATAVVTIGTLGLKLRQARESSADHANQIAKSKETEKKINNELYKDLKDAAKDTNLDVDKMGYFETLVRLNNLRVNKKNKAIGKQTGILNKMTMSLVKAADKVIGSGAGKAVFGDLAGNQREELTSPAKKRSDI